MSGSETVVAENEVMEEGTTPNDAVARFAGYVATLGRGPGRSRALTREEARDALSLVLARGVDPHQVGAFMMLLRYRGEDPDEVAGLVEAALATLAPPPTGAPQVDLDWPSYGSGRSRGAPWFLLAALALAASGRRVLMHGSNEGTSGLPVPEALRALGLAPQAEPNGAARALVQDGFAYLPLAALSPGLDELLGLRRLFGLRSPINTVARLLDPWDAPASVDGVFHPPYITLHLGVAARLGRRRLLVLKGGGGEAERAPAKATTIHLHDAAAGTAERLLPALGEHPADRVADATVFRDVWLGHATHPGAVGTVTGTIAMALLAIDPARTTSDAQAEAEAIWARRPSAR